MRLATDPNVPARSTTISDKAVPCPLDHVNRQFHALRPNALWVSDFTDVATWAGFVYGGVNSTKWPPANPGRFNLEDMAAFH